MPNEERALSGVIDTLIGAGLLQPRPKRFGVMTFSLLLPSVIQTIGLCCFGVVAFSLTEMASLPQNYRTSLVVAGSFAAAIGSDIGTLPSALEVFRKRRTGKAEWPDWATLIFSALASLAETVIALSFLGGFDVVENAWRVALLGGLTVLDAYFTISELGDWFGSYELRMEEWKEEYREAVKFYYSQDQEQKKPKEKPENGKGFCWCGKECSNRQHYAAHVGHDHRPEVLEYNSGVKAREALREKYQETIEGADWDFPELAWFNEVLRKERAQ